MEGTSACPAITQLHTCPPLVTGRGKPTKLFCLLYYTNVFLEVILFSFFLLKNILFICSIQMEKNLKPAVQKEMYFHGFFWFFW